MCCTFGSGGPFELFEGSVEDGVLLFSDSFQEKGRVVESFVLIGDGTPAPASSSARSQPYVFVLSLFIATITLVC